MDLPNIGWSSVEGSSRGWSILTNGVVRCAVAWQTQKALPGWKEHCWENLRHRVDEMSAFDVVGTEYPAAGKKHEFFPGLAVNRTNHSFASLTNSSACRPRVPQLCEEAHALLHP